MRTNVVPAFKTATRYVSGNFRSTRWGLYSYDLLIAHHTPSGIKIDLPDRYCASATTAAHLRACHDLVSHDGFAIRKEGGVWRVVTAQPLVDYLD